MALSRHQTNLNSCFNSGPLDDFLFFPQLQSSATNQMFFRSLLCTIPLQPLVSPLPAPVPVLGSDFLVGALKSCFGKTCPQALHDAEDAPPHVRMGESMHARTMQQPVFSSAERDASIISGVLQQSPSEELLLQPWNKETISLKLAKINKDLEEVLKKRDAQIRLYQQASFETEVEYHTLRTKQDLLLHGVASIKRVETWLASTTRLPISVQAREMQATLDRIEQVLNAKVDAYAVMVASTDHDPAEAKQIASHIDDLNQYMGVLRNELDALKKLEAQNVPGQKRASDQIIFDGLEKMKKDQEEKKLSLYTI